MLSKRMAWMLFVVFTPLAAGAGVAYAEGALGVQATAAWWDTEPDKPVFQGIQLDNRDPEHRLAILVETGAVSPPQVLLELDRPREIVLEISSWGPARFVDGSSAEGAAEGSKRLTYTAGTVRLPALRVGYPGQDSALTISVDGESIGDPIRIGCLGRGVIERIHMRSQAVRPAILLLNQAGRLVIIDPFLFGDPALDLPLFRRDTGSGGSPHGPGHLPGDDDDFVWCPPELWAAPEVGNPMSNNECAYILRPSGKVTWKGVSDPAAAGYSYLPESSGSLLWASAPSNIIDATYRQGWGCGVALKVPDYCTLEVKSDTGACCCGLIAVASGNICRWADTLAGSEAGWPDCPLGG